MRKSEAERQPDRPSGRWCVWDLAAGRLPLHHKTTGSPAHVGNGRALCSLTAESTLIVHVLQIDSDGAKTEPFTEITSHTVSGAQR